MTWSPPDLRIERLTWREVQRALESGWDRIVVPCGSIEQHGPHLPLLVDSEHADRLALEVAQRLGSTLVAPTIRVGCSDHHLAFAGTISLRAQTLESIYEDYCRSLARHGFRALLCFSGHGGNFPVLHAAEARLNAAVEPSARAVVFADLDAFVDAWRATAEAHVPGLGAQVGAHADVAETSVMLALRPEMVRADELEPGYLGAIDMPTVERLFREGFRTVSPNGILGDPRGMDPLLGERCIARVADILAAHFRSALGSDLASQH